MAERRQDRWTAHPFWAGVVRLAVVLVPLALSILTALVVARMLPAGETTAARVGWWLLVFAISSVVLFFSDRVFRRVLPLAVLLELSLVFPDKAPSRLRSVRTSSVRDLETKLARLRAHGATTPPLEAAETLVTLVGVLGLHDKRTRGHSERVRAFVDMITEEMGLSEDERSRARWAALVHDLGKLSVPAAVLTKPGSLDDDEWESVRRHPDEGVRLVAGLMPWLGEWGRAIGEHHERWDGLGYPNGLAGEDIALGARIVAVADSYEVMTSARSYNKARSASLARKELTVCAGAQFDPQVVRCFLSISLGRMRWVLGPLTWLAETPFLALERAGQAARLATAGVGVGGLAVAGTIAPPAAAGAAPTPAAAVDTASTGAGLAGDLLGAPAPGGRSGALVPAGPGARPIASARPTDAVLTTQARSGTPTPTPRAAATSRPVVVAQAPPQPRASAAAPAPAPKPPQSTYWFAAGGFARTAPTRTGPPPDIDGDRRPGRTVVPTKDGLDASRGTERLLLSMAVDRPLRLSGDPVVVLWSRLLAARGNARVQVRLDDCTAAGKCVALAEGQVVDGTWSVGTTFGVHEIDLSAVDVTVAKGHWLRLVLVANDAGTSSDLLVGMASRSAPSRLVLPVR